MQLTSLPSRAVLRIGGDDRIAFLQGLITQDATLLTPQRALFSALLTAQGKFLADFIMVDTGDAMLLVTAVTQREALLQSLQRYKLRAKVEISDVSSLYVHALWGERMFWALGLEAEEGSCRMFEGGIALVDPRLKELGIIILSADSRPELHALAGATTVNEESWHRHRLSLGVPDSARDITDRHFIMTLGYEALHAISFTKGCFIGQEVTARMKYRNAMPKILVQVSATASGMLPETGATVSYQNAALGDLLSHDGSHGLALLRSEEWRKLPPSSHLLAGEVEITAAMPAWLAGHLAKIEANSHV